MPRLARVDVADHAYHVINRAAGRSRIFDSDDDYRLFEQLLEEAQDAFDIRILAYVLMPNHFHLVLYPRKDGDLGRFMHQLTNAHTRHVHVRTGTIGYGPLYQGRYKSFLVQDDTHLLTVIKYVERNPVRARMVRACENWRWGSAWRRINGSVEQKKLLGSSPTPFLSRYRSWINMPDKDHDLEEVRQSVNKGMPYGKESWVERMVRVHRLESTQRGPGRPRKS